MSAAEELPNAAGLAYLASPYTHNDPGVRHLRYKEAERAMAWLMSQSIYAVSPIVACHELAIQHKLPFDAEYWSPWNSRLFFNCDRLIVLTIDGWKESKGIEQEQKWAFAMKMPVYRIIVSDVYMEGRGPDRSYLIQSI